jgi:hypothetical protein
MDSHIAKEQYDKNHQLLARRNHSSKSRRLSSKKSATPHSGKRGSRLQWLGNSNLMVSVGFAEGRQIEIKVFQVEGDKMSLMQTVPLDVSPAMFATHYDIDTGLLYLYARVRKQLKTNAQG